MVINNLYIKYINFVNINYSRRVLATKVPKLPALLQTITCNCINCNKKKQLDFRLEYGNIWEYFKEITNFGLPSMIKTVPLKIL